MYPKPGHPEKNNEASLSWKQAAVQLRTILDRTCNWKLLTNQESTTHLVSIWASSRHIINLTLNPDSQDIDWSLLSTKTASHSFLATPSLLNWKLMQNCKILTPAKSNSLIFAKCTAKPPAERNSLNWTLMKNWEILIPAKSNNYPLPSVTA